MACIAKKTRTGRAASAGRKATGKTGRKKPVNAVPHEAVEAEKVARCMYESLTAEGAPRATPTGYVLGAGYVMKMLFDQAVGQGGDRDALKGQLLAYIQVM